MIYVSLAHHWLTIDGPKRMGRGENSFKSLFGYCYIFVQAKDF
jgi:hypothetical protein